MQSVTPTLEAIEADYQMKDGMLVLNMRAQLVGYALRRWAVDCTPNSMRFTCRQPKEWAVLAMREKALQCEEFQGHERYYIASWNHHPCSVIPAARPPVDFCAAYSNLTNLTPTSNQTCPAFLNQVKVIEESLIANPATGQVLGGVKTLDSAIKECTGLGFTPKTEKHADCVLRLTK